MNTPLRLHTMDVNALWRVNAIGALVYALAFGLFTVFVIMVSWLVSALAHLSGEVFGWLVIAELAVGLVAVGTCLGMGLWNWRGLLIDAANWVDAEIKHKFPAPPTAPELPEPVTLPYTAPDRTVPVTNGSREGVEVAITLVQGFDPRDLQNLCDQLEHGMKWTEAQLECLKLPYSGEFIGKAQPGTVYTRLFGVPDGIFVRAEIIVERGSTKSGRLNVPTASEMMTKLRQLNG